MNFRKEHHRGLLFDVRIGLTNLRLNFTSDNTFLVTHEPGEDLLGHITFSLDENQQPAGYQFQPVAGALGIIFPTIAEALRAQFGEVHLRIESIVAD
jgi:hypothetical protein